MNAIEAQIAKVMPDIFEPTTSVVGFKANRGSIPAGQRNAHLTSLGGSMRRRGMTGEAIESALLQQNLTCDPPLDDQEVRSIAASVGRYEAAEGEFAKDKDGRILSGSIENIRVAFKLLEITPTFDLFAREIRVNGERFDDVALDLLWVKIDGQFKFRPSKDLLQTVLTTEAHLAPVHPVRAYLDGLAWDGQPRLDTWLATYGGAATTAHVRAVSAITLIAAVRRVRQPGCKFDEILILESKQGKFKSSALRALCPHEDLFTDDLPLGAPSKEVIERTTGRWIIEAAELHGNRGRETEQLKAFLSRQVDGPVRLAYARLPTTVARQFVVVGTTNTMLAYLKDMTGSRRFWPVAVEGFDLPALTHDRDQLWAEAASREAAGESIRLDPSLWAEAAAQQEARRAGDPWEPVLDSLLVGDGDVAYVPVAAIWDRLKLEANHLDNRHADRVAAILQRHGFTTKKQWRVDGKPQWCWLKGELS